MPTAHLYPQKMVISQTIPDKPIEPLGLYVPVRSLSTMDHVASPMPSYSCLQPHSLQEPQLGGGGGGKEFGFGHLWAQIQSLLLSWLGQVISPLWF